jgi:DNA-binding CsgD family transcriptional regulator
VSNPHAAIGRREIEVFDHYFDQHPLVRAHGRNPQAVTYRIGDLVEDCEFHRTPLYNEYYRPIRIDHVMAVPVHVEQRFLVSFVLNRSGHRGFSERDRAILELVRPQMNHLYRLGVALDGAKAIPAHVDVNKAAWLAALSLTRREREVLDWLAAGKTNRAIAAILGAKPRTVEKHLERIYEKLGVETRTAAVLRIRSR